MKASIRALDDEREWQVEVGYDGDVTEATDFVSRITAQVLVVVSDRDTSWFM